MVICKKYSNKKFHLINLGQDYFCFFQVDAKYVPPATPQTVSRIPTPNPQTSPVDKFGKIAGKVALGIGTFVAVWNADLGWIHPSLLPTSTNDGEREALLKLNQSQLEKGIPSLELPKNQVLSFENGKFYFTNLISENKITNDSRHR
jgi:hypothetical protein